MSVSSHTEYWAGPSLSHSWNTGQNWPTQLGFYSLDGLVWVWFRVGFPVFALVHALCFGDLHVFFFSCSFDVHVLLLWVGSLILGLMWLLGLFLDLRR